MRVATLVYMIIVGLGLVAVFVWGGWLCWTLRKEHHDFWWHRRKADRDDVLDAARCLTSKAPLSVRRGMEDSWSYASRLWQEMYDHRSGPGWQLDATKTTHMLTLPSISGAMRDTLRGIVGGQPYTEITTIIRTYWYSAEVDGVVHRAGILQHDNHRTPVLICDVDVRVKAREHIQSTGPLVTCLRCMSIPRP